MTESASLEPYNARVYPTLEPFGGLFVKPGSAPFEGDAPYRMVMIPFESWRRRKPGTTHRPIGNPPIRDRSATTRAYIVHATGG